METVSDNPLSAELTEAIGLVVHHYGGVAMIPCVGVTDLVVADLQRAMRLRQVAVSMRTVERVQYLRFDVLELPQLGVQFGGN